MTTKAPAGHTAQLHPHKYSYDTATAVVCSCGRDGCDRFPTGKEEDAGVWLRENATVSVRELRHRAHILDRAHRRFNARVGKVTGDKDWGSIRGIWSSMKGLAEVAKMERLLVNEELRRRGAPVPPVKDRWWDQVIPLPGETLRAAVPFIYTSLAAWTLIGAFHLFRGWTTGEWSFLGGYLLWRGIALVTAGIWNRA